MLSVSGYQRVLLYDTLGRTDGVITSVDSRTFYQRTTFDAVGRVYQSFDAAGDGSYTDLGTTHRSRVDRFTYDGLNRLLTRWVAGQANDYIAHSYRSLSDSRGKLTNSARFCHEQEFALHRSSRPIVGIFMISQRATRTFAGNAIGRSQNHGRG